MYFSPVSCCLLSPWHSVFKHPQSTFFHTDRDTKFHTLKTADEIPCINSVPKRLLYVQRVRLMQNNKLEF
jgi:hypothetical protein